MRTRGLEAAVIWNVHFMSNPLGCWTGFMGKEKSRQSFRCGGFVSQRRSEDYGAPRPGMGEAMTEIDFGAQAEHDTG